ncbi:hypothetical protein [Dyella sp. A6]|uniref:hypothetical protein n=1 Tax=Dyella aluminiiresistens TaxID=3069105 RepID=UPI002E7937DC|nr:hypothetical protein [Dyella sp. A6]
MPLPPSDPIDWPPVRVTMESPREAALRAIVYRNHLRELPRERGLRIVALVGTLLVHLVFLLGAVLGPAYVPDQVHEPYGDVLHVRLIDNKPQPPPPPPIRGTPPKRHGPRHRGHAASQVAARTANVAHRQTATAAPTAQPLPPVPAPPIDRPVIVVQARPSAPVPKIVAAPLPSVSVPKPAPAPRIQPIAVSPPPPAITLQAPVAVQPVPPRFQPEPVRKAQVEGTRPMPPPPSLALPQLPAQSAPKVAPPAVALDRSVTVAVARPSVSVVTHVEPPAAPPAPALQAVPLPALPAPTVNLQSTLDTPLPSVPRLRQQVQSPAIRVAPAQLTAVPLPPAYAAPATPRLQAPSVDIQPPTLPSAPLATQPPLAKVDVQLPSTVSARPAVPVHAPPMPTPAAPAMPKPVPTRTAAKTSASKTSAPHTSATKTAAAQSTQSSPSRAPDATPTGSDNANPGQPGGVVQTTPPTVPTHTGDFAAPVTGQGRVPGARGHGTQGSPEGTYIQLVPHGDTRIMSHRVNGFHYTPTIFNKYWTPEGESSIDTALRRAVEKTTVSHTFHLPRGVRVKCVAMPLLPMLLFGCGNPDPPAKPLDPKIYRQLNLPTLNASIPKVAPPASAPAPAVPVKLTNAVQCADARVAGGPMPPGCGAATVVRPVLSPATAGSSWAPASDQFH